MKLREVRIAKGFSQRELAKAIEVDEPTLSKFENFKVLPIPDTMKRLTSVLDVDVEEIYEPKEINLGKLHKAPSKAPPSYYHLTVKLPLEAKGILKESLRPLGYKGITEWITKCYEQIVYQKKEDSPHATKQ